VNRSDDIAPVGAASGSNPRLLEAGSGPNSASTPGALTPIRFTVLTNTGGQPIGKVVKLVDGAPKTTSSNNARPDSYEVVECTSAEAIANVLKDLGPARCITAGVPANGTTKGSIQTRDQRAEHPLPDSITMGADDWVFPEGPGILLLDYDPKTPAEGFPERLRLTPERWRAAVSGVARGLLSCAVYAPSSGSCIHRPKDPVPPPKGFHHYVAVAEARDIPRAGRVLFDRLVLAGYGYAEVFKNGSVAVRSIVDASVWRIYAGGAKCGPGLEQSRTFVARPGAPANTRAGEEVEHAA
jgi:hypothetical protein